MPDQETFEAALNQTAEYVEGLGHELIERSVKDILEGNVRGEQYSLTGHRCDGETGEMYIVAGHPELRFFSVLYFFSVERYVGSRLPGELVDNIIDQTVDDLEQIDPDSMDQIVGRELLERVDEDEMAALKSYLFMFISEGANTTYIQTSDSGSIDTFLISNDFFPYEEEFSIREFSDAVQRTINAGGTGSKLVERTVFTELDEEEEIGATIKLNFGW